ncbi:MAG TPA: hypothetical protein VFU35_07590 [Jatrophihabitans sp.]|nr:hypothetical protein [Jatrophihabitans sp.]
MIAATVAADAVMLCDADGLGDTEALADTGVLVLGVPEAPAVVVADGPPELLLQPTSALLATIAASNNIGPRREDKAT